MADFYVTLTGTNLQVATWQDPATSDKPSRISPVNERQHKRYVAAPNSSITLSAILLEASVVQPDSEIGLFTMWAIEWPTDAGQPLQTTPTSGTSAVQTFVLNGTGHYTFGVRHEDTQDADNAAAGGCVVVHVDSGEVR